MSESQEQNYRELLDEISAMVASTRVMGTQETQQRKVEIYWEMSRRIADADEGPSGRERYGANVVRRLSADLRAQYGAGFGRSNVYNIRNFSKLYARESLKPELTWSHYRALLTVADEQRRDQLEQKAVNGDVSVKQFEKLVRTMAVFHSLKPSKKVLRQKLDELLVPRRGTEGIFKVVVEPFGRREAFLDLGFDALEPVGKESVSGFASGDLVRERAAGQWQQSQVGKGGKRNAGKRNAALVKTECEAGERYCYRGTLLNVVDGDTLLARALLGFGRTQRVKIRLRGVDVAEPGTAKGDAAKVFVEQRLPIGSPVRFLTYSFDKYHRWIGDVFYGKDQFLNRELIETGMADFLDMGRKIG